MTITTPVGDGMSPKQLRSIREARGKVNVWEGSVRSGKTIASLLAFLLAIALHTGYGEIVVISRTRDSAARNVFAPLQDPRLFGAIAKTVHYSPGSPNGTILGRRVWVLGSSDRRSENVLRGLTCALAYVDEITLLQYDFWAQLLNRLWTDAKLFGTTNPDSPAHWFKANYLDRLDKLIGWRKWKFYLDDNPALDLATKQRIRRENVGLFYRRNVLGEWVAGEGAVYDAWDPDRHVIPWAELPVLDLYLSAGIDYGTTNATAAVLLGIGDRPDGNGRALYAVDEYVYNSRTAQRRKTDKELSADLREFVDARHHPKQAGYPARVFADPSAASLREQMRLDGLPTQAADNDVAYGIRTIASLLGSDRMYVSSRCAGLISEIPGYAYDPKATLLGEDKPVKVADHSLDAWRYATISTEASWRELLAA